MAVITQQEFSSLLEKGIDKARQTTEQVLISQSILIPSIDPIVFFANGARSYKGQRTFWFDSVNETTIVGLGKVWGITSDRHHFREVETKWEALRNNMILESRYSNINGVGPLLLGGFSFDPLNPKTPIWNNFPATAFTLPKWNLTICNNRTFLTVNMLVNRYTQVEEVAEELTREKSEILQSSLFRKEKTNHLLYEEIGPNRWMKTIEKMTKEIQKGAFQKVVLARQLEVYSTDQDYSVEQVLTNLVLQQPDSYIFAFERGEDCFLGASPERLIKKEGNQLLSTCLAGTTKRGISEKEDRFFGNKLLNDQKNLQEHQLVVNMIKEAMEEVCDSIILPEKPTLYKVRDIQHLYTPVIGIGNNKTRILAMVKKLHPTPALGGYPQRQAVQIIRSEEKMDRGWYSAPIGWLDYKGDGEFAVAIRSGLISTNRANLYAGCGIVSDSDPISEYQETKMKFQPMLSALGGSKIDTK